MDEAAIFIGSANRSLGEAAAAILGIVPATCRVSRFPDGEVAVRLEHPVRGADVVLVQGTSAPVNDNLMELLALADACRRAAARRITAVIPYFGYARMDTRGGRREPLTARLVAQLIETAGVAQVITVDLHTPQIEGFFTAPLDNLSAVPTLCDTLATELDEDAVVVAPDLGAARLATRYARALGAPLTVLHKQRHSGSEVAVTHLVGEVGGRSCVIVDDMISTGGTVASCAEALRDAGAREGTIAVATHGVLVAGARQTMLEAGVTRLVLSDTIPLAPAPGAEVHTVSVASLLAEAIRRVLGDKTLAELL